VQGYASHEREVFENVTKARALATQATGGPAEQAAAEGPFVAALRQLLAVAENYPDLKANENFLALQAERSNTQDRLPTARLLPNGNVRAYTPRVESFPSMIVPNAGPFEAAEFFEVDESLRGDAGVPKVDFSSLSTPAPEAPAAPPPEVGSAPPAPPAAS